MSMAVAAGAFRQVEKLLSSLPENQRIGLHFGVIATTANDHDSKAVYPLIVGIAARYLSIKTLKANNGYRGSLTEIAKTALSVDLQCVKSNSGTSEFIPLEGRWVVERTIAWLDRFRRLCRNYERLLPTATARAKMAVMMVVLKHI